ncbi:hypothetical protein [Micromonospora narathiwatensis]|nr:hypothetical protein [Micromonospora narathiwatensis]
MNARPQAAVALTLSLAVAGCAASGETAPATPSTTRATSTAAPASMAAPVRPPAQPGFAYADPEEVCRRFVAALYGADTRSDAGPGDAFRRAVRFASGTLAGQSAAAERDGRWLAWSAHRAYLDALVEPFVDAQLPPDTAITARRAVRVTATAIGEDGWRGWTEHSVADCVLHRGGPDGPGWRVTDYEIRQAGLR